MDLEQELKKDGYYEAKELYDSMVKQRAFMLENIEDYKGEERQQAEAALAELDRTLPVLKQAMERSYAAVVGLVDAEHDVDFARAALLGQLEQMGDAVEDKAPEMAEWLHTLAEGYDPGPMPELKKAGPAVTDEEAREAELSEKIGKATEIAKHIYIIIKHQKPHLLDGFTEACFGPLTPEMREEFLADVAVLESTKLDAILKGED